MGLETDTAPATPAVDTAPPGDSSQVAPKKTRAPADPAKRLKAAQRQAVRRVLEQLEEAQTVDELWSLAEKKRGGKADEPKKPAPDAGAAAQAAPSSVIPAGWPDPALVAQVEPTLLESWGQVLALVPSRYAPAPRKVRQLEKLPDGSTKITEAMLAPEEILAAGTAPLVAKWTGNAAGSPEGMALATVLGFAVPLGFAVGRDLFVSWWMAREAPAGPPTVEAKR